MQFRMRLKTAPAVTIVVRAKSFYEAFLKLADLSEDTIDKWVLVK